MEQNLYELMKSLEGENFHLKNQLSRRNKDIQGYKKIISAPKEKLEDKKKKQHYRNGQKRGRTRNG